MNAPRPNILYLHCHDAGRFVQPYGYAIQTPHLQRLAEQGVLFRQAFCAGPTCSPSRAALLTGQNNHSNGMLGLAHRGFRLTDYRRHIIHTLHAAGYTSALAGTQHVASEPFSRIEDIGYEHILTREGGLSDATTAAAAFLDQAPDHPFFLSVGYAAPHRSGKRFQTVFPPEDARYCLPPPPLPDTPVTRHDMSLYMASVRSTDLAMGTVLAALDRNGLAENTLVICTTDHGIAFPSMKCNLTAHGMGVMLILRGPSGITGGKALHTLTSQIDVFPTVCDLLDIPAPDWLEGVSLLPAVRGEQDEVRNEVFAEINFHAAYEPQRAVRTHRWNYVRRYDGRDSVVLPNCDNSPSKALWCEAGWTAQPRHEEMLFDLVFDPCETHNVLGQAGTEEVTADLRGRLDRWMADTDDPLLTGPIQPPAGAKVTDPDLHSPNGRK